MPPRPPLDGAPLVIGASPVHTEFSASTRVVIEDPLRPFHAAKPVCIVVKFAVPKFCKNGRPCGGGFVCPSACVLIARAASSAAARVLKVVMSAGHPFRTLK